MLIPGDIELDPARRQVSRDGQPIELTRKEFGVLEVLMDADGATVSAEELSSACGMSTPIRSRTSCA